MNGFEVEEVVVGDVDANAEVEARVASVDDLVVAELHEVGVLGIANWKNTNITKESNWKVEKALLFEHSMSDHGEVVVGLYGGFTISRLWVQSHSLLG